MDNMVLVRKGMEASDYAVPLVPPLQTHNKHKIFF